MAKKKVYKIKTLPTLPILDIKIHQELRRVDYKKIILTVLLRFLFFYSKTLTQVKKK